MKNNTLEIIKVLIEKTGESTSIRQLSQDLRINYKNVYNIVKKLQKESLISLEKFGRAYNCILNKKVHPLIFHAEYERRKKLLKNRNLQVLHEKLKSFPFSFIALIFGSYAKGDASKDSDIDLMIICEKNRERDIESTISLLPLDIHVVTLTHEEFLSMAKTKEFSVVLEAMDNNIILIGIEDYYRLIGNVGR